MAILDANTAAALSAILVIYIGITVEKYYVSWSSVYTNTLSLFVTLAALDLEMSVLILLLIYTILGYIAVKMRWKKIFPIFGCKSFGSLMLVLTLGSNGILFGVYTWYGVLISWVIVAVCVHYIGWRYVRWSRRRRSRKY